MRGGDRKELLGWYFFDFANTSFTVMIVTVGYAIYFKSHVAVDLTITLPWGEREAGTFLWGAATALSMLLVGLTSPYLGAVADGTARKKLFTGLYSALCIGATLLMVTVGRGEVVWGLALFILANIGFQGGLVFYNAFLPQITTPERVGYVSGVGFAWGYVGALLTLGLALPFASKATATSDLTALAPAFGVSALFFLVFMIPFFLWVRERPPVQRGTGSAWREGWVRVADTVGHLRTYRETGKFLIAYFIYSDGINTVIAFGGIYAAEVLGFTALQVIFFFAIIQLAAIAGAWFFGYLTDRIGARTTIELTLALWTVMCVVAFMSTSQGVFYLAGVLAGVAMGSSQSASRALMTELTPRDREAEFFGFYGLCGKFSAILGPLVYGSVATVTGSQRWAVLSVGVFFLTGWGLLRLVDTKAGREALAELQEAAP